MEQLKNSSANMGQKISEQDFDNRSMNINETTISREDNFEEDFEFYIEGRVTRICVNYTRPCNHCYSSKICMESGHSEYEGVTLTFVASFGIVGE